VTATAPSVAERRTRATPPDGATRAVVWCQRHPWLASLGATAVIVGAFNPWTLRWIGGAGGPMIATFLLLAPAAVASVAHAGRGGRTTSDRLAPWFAANLGAMAAALLFVWYSDGYYAWTRCIRVTAPFAVWPLLTTVLLPGEVPGGPTPAALVGYPATLVLFPPLAAVLWPGPEVWAIVTIFSLTIVPLAVHAVLRCRAPTKAVLLAATIYGTAAWLLENALPQPMKKQAGGFYAEVREMAWPVPVLVWVAGALMAVAARRCRGMTAVPTDHPIVTDFGGR
jgi:hypothetical protein